jgi:hypothetical protein
MALRAAFRQALSMAPCSYAALVSASRGLAVAMKGSTNTRLKVAAYEILEERDGEPQFAVSCGSRARRPEGCQHAGQTIDERHVHERQDWHERE